MNSKIRVLVRVRPQLASEKAHSSRTLQWDDHMVRLRLNNASAEKVYRFDHVLGPKSSQEDMYDAAGVEQSIASVLEGYHATLFAYGQTGSGKTFTMEGYSYERTNSTASRERVQSKANVAVASSRVGIIPRVIINLFDAIQTASVLKNKTYRVKCSCVQIYNEQVRRLILSEAHLAQILDLLNPAPTLHCQNRCLRLRWSPEHEFYVEDLTMVECESAADMMGVFHDAIKQKIMATTNLNAASSRSHCIYTLYIESSDAENPGVVTTTKFCLVDLAGSERIMKTGASGVTLQESIGINKSLFVLRQVIQILSDEASNGGTALAKSHVPYRDSKLTSLLKHSLGGNSITIMVVCLAPSDLCFEENLSTLQYAARAQCISNTPVKNADTQMVLVQQLRDQIKLLTHQLHDANTTIEWLKKQAAAAEKNHVLRPVLALDLDNQSDSEGPLSVFSDTDTELDDDLDLGSPSVVIVAGAVSPPKTAATKPARRPTHSAMFAVPEAPQEYLFRDPGMMLPALGGIASMLEVSFGFLWT
ncbi:Kinesin motor domain containing protein [Achlya hypogyna]|uniref:Kinesin motor domain containing protein n=1 Tax=Achlya hypogyna TaxID=1202772 RepID=A0A1V9Z7E1_ACHHY|nr:Kinesin motor domain containing protein [Achlya hypogyna]